MRIFRRILLIAGILALAGGIPYFGYLLFTSLDRPLKNPVQAIPDKTALIIKVNKPLELLGELTRNNLIWKDLVKYPGIRPVQDQILLLDSMTRGNYEIRQIINNSPLFITLSLHSRASFDPLFLTSVPATLDGQTFSSFLEESYPGKITILQSPYARTEIFRIHFENKRNVLFAAIHEGVCMLSFQDILVKKAIDKLSLNTPVSIMTGFNTVASTTGKKVDANVYINFPYFSLAVWKSVNKDHNSSLVKFAQFADWSGLDLFIKKDELLLNGYTIASDNEMQSLALISDQAPGSLSITNILPNTTQAYLIYAFNNYPALFNRWENRRKRAQFNVTGFNLFEEMNERCDTTVRLFLDQWMGNQAGRCWIKPSRRDSVIFPVTIIQTSLPDSARKNLLILAHVMDQKVDSVIFKNHMIYRANVGKVMNIWLNPLLDPAILSNFTIIDDYICFAESHTILEKFLDRKLNNDLLKEIPAYLELDDNILDQASLSFYCNSRSLLDYLPEVLTTDYLPLFTPILDSLKKFQSIAVQLSSEGRMFFTNLLVHFNPKTTDEGPMVWQTALDTLVAGTPQITRSNTGQGFAVLVTDTNNTLYKIDAAGKIRWKKKLYGRVLGTFHDIRIKDHDSLFYLFNTANHLYLIRSDGEIAQRFPMKFPVRASNGLCLKKSVHTGEYEVIIAFRNNRIYNFNLTGQLVDGWQSPTVIEEVTTPISHISLGYLFITSKDGTVLITDQNGVERITPEKSFSNSPNSAFYVNRTNPKAPFLTTDPDGYVIYLNRNGKTSRVSFNAFSPNHYFLYEDIMGDGTPEFIFFDNNTIYYYNRFFNLIYFYTFRHDVSPPHLIKTLSDKIFIGIVSPTTNEVFLFDRHGYVEIESGVQGTTPFDIGTLEREYKLNLVIGSGKYVKNFRLTQF